MDTVKNRYDWVDAAKGIAMLFVIVGHTIKGDVLAVIYSFHMPLFFVLSGFTSKSPESMKDLGKRTVRLFKSLLVPTFLVYAVVTVFEYFYVSKGVYTIDGLTNYLWGRVQAVFFWSGSPVKINGQTYQAIGMIWFVAVMFFGRLIYDLIRIRIKGVFFVLVITGLSIGGALISRIIWLPFSFDLALGVLLFFLMGKWFRREVDRETSYSLKKGASPEKYAYYTIVWFISLIMWLGIHFISMNQDFLPRSFEMTARNYGIYPFSLLMILGATIVISLLCMLFCKLKRVSFPLRYLGRYSLVMFLVHYSEGHILKIDWHSFGGYSWFFRIILDVILFAVCMGMITWLKKLRKVKVRDI